MGHCETEQKAKGESNCHQPGRQSPDLTPENQDRHSDPEKGEGKGAEESLQCKSLEGVILPSFSLCTVPLSVSQCGSNI